MLRRIGFLSLVAFVCGGLVWWSAMPHTAVGSDHQDGGSAATAAKSWVKESFPAPPEGRAEGDFDLDVAGQAEKRIEAALVNPQGVDLSFIDTPLSDAMDFLADAHDITILIDNVELKEEGIESDVPIDLELSGVTLKSALNIMLDPLGLTYVIEDEVLKITTKKAADAKRITRVYNTGYLNQVGVEPDALGETIQAVIEPTGWQSSAPPKQTVAKTGNSTVFIQSPRKSSGRQSSERIQSAIGENGAMLGTVKFGDSKSPKPKQTESNSLRVLGDMLVVSAPRSVHEKIQALLVQVDRRWAFEHGKK